MLISKLSISLICLFYLYILGLYYCDICWLALPWLPSLDTTTPGLLTSVWKRLINIALKTSHWRCFLS